jgi:hypothetical protein
VYHRGVSWSRNGYEDDSKPVVYDGKAFWAEYRTHQNQPYYRLMQADLKTGEHKILLYLDTLPDEVAAFENGVAWKNGFWDEQGYRCIIRMLDLQNNTWRVLVDTDEYCYGLGAFKDVLAWKQGPIEYGNINTDDLRVYHATLGSTAYRASSEEARVAADLPVVVGDGFLIWLDYREGNYRITALDLAGRRESFLSSDTALISTYISPAAGSRSVIWTDYQNGDSDLFLFRF